MGDLNNPSEGMSTLGAQFTRNAVDKITGAVRKLIDKGWAEKKIMKKMNAELANYDPHTIRRLYDLSAGTFLEDDIDEGNVQSAEEVKPGTFQVQMKKPLRHLKSTGLARYKGEDWYIAGVRDAMIILKKLG